MHVEMLQPSLHDSMQETFSMMTTSIKNFIILWE